MISNFSFRKSNGKSNLVFEGTCALIYMFENILQSFDKLLIYIKVSSLKALSMKYLIFNI